MVPAYLHVRILFGFSFLVYFGGTYNAPDDIFRILVMNDTGSIRFLLSSYVIRGALPSTLKRQDMAMTYSLDIDIKGAAA